MASNRPEQSRGGGLPNPYTYQEKSSPPTAPEEKVEQKKIPAFHNPHGIKRPQPKNKARGIPASKRPMLPTTRPEAPSQPAMSPQPELPSQPAATATSAPEVHRDLDHYRTNVEEDAAILDNKRARERKQKEEKKLFGKLAQKHGNWWPQEPYDASKATNVVFYKQTDALGDTIDEFDKFLRSQRSTRSRRASSDRIESSRPTSSSSSQDPTVVASRPSFAPPREYYQDKSSRSPANDEEDRSSVEKPSGDPGRAIDSSSGEDAYARRALLSHSAASNSQAPSPALPVADADATVPPVPRTVVDVSAPRSSITSSNAAAPSVPPPALNHVPANNAKRPSDQDEHLAKKQKLTENTSHAISAPPPHYNNPTPQTASYPTLQGGNTVLSAEPIRYNLPETNNATLQAVKNVEAESEEDEPPAKKQKLSVAETMMANMGYKKGQGLGKDETGITTHLYHKARKGDTRLSLDDEKKTVKQQLVYDIQGGKPAKSKSKAQAKYGEESSVIVAWGLLDGVDWDAEYARNEGSIQQDIGDEFNPKFGQADRIHVRKDGEGQPVYMKFQSVYSAMNAVSRFSEGLQFRGRDIRAVYYPEKKFEAGIWDY